MKRYEIQKIQKKTAQQREEKQLVREDKSNYFYSTLSGPDQNATNLTNIELSDPCKSLLSKGPSFVATSYDINWYNLRQDVDNFVNKTHFTFQNSNLQLSLQSTMMSNNQKIHLSKILLKQPIFKLKQLTLIVQKHLQKKMNRVFSIQRMLTPKCFITSQKKKEKLLFISLIELKTLLNNLFISYPNLLISLIKLKNIH